METDRQVITRKVGADTTDDLWRFSSGQHLNMAQDRFFRRAVFSASVRINR